MLGHSQQAERSMTQSQGGTQLDLEGQGFIMATSIGYYLGSQVLKDQGGGEQAAAVGIGNTPIGGNTQALVFVKIGIDGFQVDPYPPVGIELHGGSQVQGILGCTELPIPDALLVGPLERAIIQIMQAG